MRLIDADALEPHEQLEPMGNGEYEYVEVVYKDDIDDSPTIDAKPVKHGEWIMHIDDLFPEESTMECNQCHEHQPLTIDDNYCPNCGAKMNR